MFPQNQTDLFAPNPGFRNFTFLPNSPPILNCSTTLHCYWKEVKDKKSCNLDPSGRAASTLGTLPGRHRSCMGFAASRFSVTKKKLGNVLNTHAFKINWICYTPFCVNESCAHSEQAAQLAIASWRKTPSLLLRYEKGNDQNWIQDDAVSSAQRAHSIFLFPAIRYETCKCNTYTTFVRLFVSRG